MLVSECFAGNFWLDSRNVLMQLAKRPAAKSSTHEAEMTVASCGTLIIILSFFQNFDSGKLRELKRCYTNYQPYHPCRPTAKNIG